MAVQKIYISKAGITYRFLSCILNESDGSFYVVIERDGFTSEHLTFSKTEPEIKDVRLEQPRKKTKRVSYHSSGTVIYHDLSYGSQYFEPISEITSSNHFFRVVIPAVEKLEMESSTDEEALILNLDEVHGSVQFDFVIAPWNTSLEVTSFSLRYHDLFSLIVLFGKPTTEILDIPPDHFVYASIDGKYEKPMLEKDESLIKFHQQLHKTDGSILYSANGDGVYKLIFSVAMRVAPKVGMTFEDSSHRLEVVGNTSKSVLRFKVIDERGKPLAHDEFKILGYFLDAELY